jgi:hypothetical protein
MMRWSKSSPGRNMSTLRRSFCFVLTSEMSVSIGGNDFENSIIDRQNRYVKCASTKIENQDVLFTFLVQTVSNGRRGWLIDNSSDV